MVELAEIFQRYGSVYRAKYGNRLLPSHLKAMQAIERCPTEALGGQVYYCKHCQQSQYSYHSCRNRYCPKCQHQAAEQWLARQQAFRLPVPHFIRRTIFLWSPSPCLRRSETSLVVIRS